MFDHTKKSITGLSSKRALLATASLGAVLSASLLTAQAHAQVGNDQIIVTAQKREQNLQDVSKAISVYSGEDLRERGISDIDSLAFQTPAISFGEMTGLANIFVRGLGLNTVFPNVDPSVTIYEDGAIINQPSAQLFSFFDLDRLEVLRGPQGTLYGRNSTGGQINLITAKPTEDLSGYINASVGNFGAVEVDAAISGPIIGDSLLGRFAIHSDTRNGYGINEYTGNDINDRNRQALRAQLEWRAADNFNVLLVGEYGRENDASNAVIFLEEVFSYENGGFPDLAAYGIVPPAGTPAPGALPPGRGGTIASGQLNANDPAIILAGGPTEYFFPTGGPRNTNTEIDPSNQRETISISAIADWDLNDIFSVKNTLNYRTTETTLIEDIELSANAVASNQRLFYDAEQISEELQLNIDTDRLHGVGGFFYFNEDVRNENYLGHSPTGNSSLDNPALFEAFGIPGDGQRVFLFGDANVESWALYWNLAFDIVESVTIKAGGRYTSDKRTVYSENYIIPGGAFLGNTGFGPVLIIGGPPVPPGPPTVATPFNNPAINPSFALPFVEGSETFTDYTNEFGIEWRPNDNLLFYYTYSEGFKAGTAQIAVADVSVQPGLLPGFLKPETITSHEAGVKSTWLDGALVTNVTGFTYTVDDIQLDLTLPGGPQGFQSLFQNATTQDAWGIEFETYWEMTDQLRFNGSVAYLDTEYGSFVTTNPVVLIEPSDIGGNRARQSPVWSAAAHLEYDLPVSFSSGDLLTAAVDLGYKGDQYFSEFNDPRLMQEAYTILDASLRYQFADDRLSLTFWGRNLTDELVKSGSFAFTTALSVGGNYLPPRTYGASLGFEF